MRGQRGKKKGQNQSKPKSENVIASTEQMSYLPTIHWKRALQMVQRKEFVSSVYHVRKQGKRREERFDKGDNRAQLKP